MKQPSMKYVGLFSFGWIPIKPRFYNVFQRVGRRPAFIPTIIGFALSTLLLVVHEAAADMTPPFIPRSCVRRPLPPGPQPENPPTQQPPPPATKGNAAVNGIILEFSPAMLVAIVTCGMVGMESIFFIGLIQTKRKKEATVHLEDDNSNK